jgi:hypothetical protein
MLSACEQGIQVDVRRSKGHLLAGYGAKGGEWAANMLNSNTDYWPKKADHAVAKEN